MAKKRTREQKIIAQLRRELQKTAPIINETQTDEKMVYRNTASANYVPGRQLPVKSIYKDLWRTVTITAIGIGVQFAVKAYLDRGGWALVMKVAGA